MANQEPLPILKQEAITDQFKFHRKDV